MKKLVLDLLKNSFKPLAIIKEIKSSPDGGAGVLHRPAVVKMAMKFVFFWGTLSLLLIALGKGWITVDQLIQLLGISEEVI